MINICDDVLIHIHSFIRPEWLYYTNKNYFENYLKDGYMTVSYTHLTLPTTPYV